MRAHTHTVCLCVYTYLCVCVCVCCVYVQVAPLAALIQSSTIQHVSSSNIEQSVAPVASRLEYTPGVRLSTYPIPALDRGTHVVCIVGMGVTDVVCIVGIYYISPQGT